MRIVRGFSAVLLSAALCFSTTTAAVASACQPGQAGCVLPVGVAPQPSIVVNQPAPILEEEVGGGIGWLPILIGLAALGLGAYFLFIADDDEGPVVSP